MKRIERLLRAIDRFQQRHSVLGFPFGVVKKYGDDRGGRHAALLAHYGLLCLFPLLLVFVTVLGYALANDPQLQEDVIETLARQFPVLGSQIEGSIRTIQGSGLALVVGVLGTLWGGLGITQSFQDAMNDIWNIPRRRRPNFWWRLARGLGALVLVAGEVVAATVLAQQGHRRPRAARPGRPAGRVVPAQPAAAGGAVPDPDRDDGPLALAAAGRGRRGARVERAPERRRGDRQPPARAGQPGLRGVRGGDRAARLALPELPAGAVRGRDQRGPGPAAVAAQHAPAAAHRAGPPGADRARPDRGAPARAAGPGHLPPRGGRRRRPARPRPRPGAGSDRTPDPSPRPSWPPRPSCWPGTPPSTGPSRRPAYVPANLAVAGLSVLAARRRRVPAADLGLGRDRLAQGLRVGLAATAPVAAAVALGAAVPGDPALLPATSGGRPGAPATPCTTPWSASPSARRWPRRRCSGGRCSACSSSATPGPGPPR